MTGREGKEEGGGRRAARGGGGGTGGAGSSWRQIGSSFCGYFSTSVSLVHKLLTSALRQ